MTEEEYLIRDLSKHFRSRVSTLVDDSMDTCARADVSHKYAVTIIVKNLLFLAAVGSISNGVNREEFGRMCAKTYDEVLKCPR
jgi:hypothetical protein